MYSKDTSDNKAINGLAAAGGWTLFKNIIKATDTPTDSPKEIKETPINSLKRIPIIIQIKWPKKILEGWAKSLLYKTSTINALGPKDIMSQNPVDVS